MTWSLKKPVQQFPEGTRVCWSSLNKDEHTSELGEGPFVVAYSYITSGGENSNAEEGRWWGEEKVVISSIIEGIECVAAQLLQPSKALKHYYTPDYVGIGWTPRYTRDSDGTIRDKAKVGGDTFEKTLSFDHRYLTKL